MPPHNNQQPVRGWSKSTAAADYQPVKGEGIEPASCQPWIQVGEHYRCCRCRWRPPIVPCRRPCPRNNGYNTYMPPLITCWNSLIPRQELNRIKEHCDYVCSKPHADRHRCLRCPNPTDWAGHLATNR